MTTSPPPPPRPPAGWYPDPTGKPGEMYWDGEAWHRLSPGTAATSQSDHVGSGNDPALDIPARSAAATPPPPSGHYRGRHLGWLLIALGIILSVGGFLLVIPLPLTVGFIVLIIGLVLTVVGRRGSATPKAGNSPHPLSTRNRRLILVTAVLVGVGVVAAIVAKPILYRVYCTHMPTCRYYPPSSPSSGVPDSPQSGSPYYQEGYNSGTSGLARKGYGDNMYNTGATVAEMEHQACANAINNESNLASIEDSDHPANQDDYMKGCLKAFSDHPPAGKPKPGPLNPYR